MVCVVWKEALASGSTGGCEREKDCILELSILCVTDPPLETSPSTVGGKALSQSRVSHH